MKETQFGTKRHYKSELLIRPKIANRPPVPIEVPTLFAEDYNEACLVIIDSPKASAALSRRCLQFSRFISQQMDNQQGHYKPKNVVGIN